MNLSKLLSNPDIRENSIINPVYADSIKNSQQSIPVLQKRLDGIVKSHQKNPFSCDKKFTQHGNDLINLLKENPHGFDIRCSAMRDTEAVCQPRTTSMTPDYRLPSFSLELVQLTTALNDLES